MKRQAIFLCLTCTPDGNAGVCTACSLSCHDGHEIVELWTKRNFRCDCGNSKFGEFFCKLFPNKDIENVENSYNHNFKGSYCTCGRPYPDPEAEEQVEMIQCCICEDWFHEEHIGLESSDEMRKCGNFYTQKGIGFLLDKEDSIAEYEKMAKEKRDEKLQQQEGVELNFLNKLGHVEKMEILNGIADMKNEIHSFLESFDSSKPITSEDVHQVFENLAKKRRRMP